MSKKTSITIVIIILVIMGIAAGVVISLFDNMKSTILGKENATKNNTAQYIQINDVQNTAAENNLVENQVVANNVVNEIISQNTINPVENVVNIVEQQNVVNEAVVNTIPEQPVNRIVSQIVDTGVITNLGDNTSKLMISSYDVYSVFISTYVGNHNSEVLNSYNNREYFESKNLGVIYVPLRNNQNFDVSELKIENNKLVATYRYAGISDGPATRGYLILIETDKTVTDIEVIN